MKYSIKELRQIRKWTQQDAADHLGISVRTYSRWERNPAKLEVSKAVLLADLYGVRLSEIEF